MYHLLSLHHGYHILVAVNFIVFIYLDSIRRII